MEPTAAAVAEARVAREFIADSNADPEAFVEKRAEEALGRAARDDAAALLNAPADSLENILES